MKEVSPFRDALSDIRSVALNARHNGKKVIGTLCTYAPEEIIHAAGCHPMRLFSTNNEIILAEKHLQSYCCSMVRGVLEDSLSGRFDFLEGTVFPHTCDSMQRLSDIWRMKNQYPFFADVVLPVKLNTPSAEVYMNHILTRFRQDLETVAGKKITDADITASIRLYNTIKTHLSDIYALQSEHPGILSGSDLNTIVRATMVMEKEAAARALGRIVDMLRHQDPAARHDKRLILSGSVCDVPDIFTAVESAGGMIAGDDLCTGQRWFHTLTDENIPPLDALAKRYMSRMPCPAKHDSLSTRADALVDLARKNKARGVLFLLLKFCDPHSFDYPFLKDTLEKKGIKTLLVETDGQQQSHAQLFTRIETFIHTL